MCHVLSPIVADVVWFREAEDQDVAEFEITVDNAHFLMQIDECIGDLWNEGINVQHMMKCTASLILHATEFLQVVCVQAFTDNSCTMRNMLGDILLPQENVSDYLP